MATVLITGGTGLIGKELSAMLVTKGYKVIILTRGKGEGKHESAGDVSYAQWDPAKQIMDVNAIDRSDYIVHLAGAGVADERWTPERKKEIAESRTESGALLVKSLQQNVNKVKAVISSSAIGWYGADPVIPNSNPFVETDKADKGFLGETCRMWEDSIQPVSLLNKRLVILRTGIVLSNDGGALREFKKPVRFGVAGILGNGKQVISWIHIGDLCCLYINAIENTSLNGVYNAVAPYPVSNKELTVILARYMNGKYFIPMHIPSLALKIALGEMSEEVLKSATVSASKISNSGFEFLFPDIDSALEDIIDSRKKTR